MKGVMSEKLGKKLIRREEHTYKVFKITPHSSNLNSTSRKFQHSIFELFSYRYPKYPWQRGGGLASLSKENIYVTLKENPKFWWIIKMYGDVENLVVDSKSTDADKGSASVEDKIKENGGNVENEQKKAEPEYVQRIEFYVAVPSDFTEAFKTKFNTHIQWQKATLEEVEDEFEFSELENTDMYHMKYLRNDMFSLNFDYTQQETPIRDIMSVSRELKAGEAVYLFIQTETVDRKKWKKIVDYAWDVWERGKVPSRAGVDPRMLINDIKYFALVSAYECKGVIDDVLDGIGRSFLNDKSREREKKKPTYINAEREALLVDGDLSPMTKKKRNKPVFKTNIVYTVTSPDVVRRDMLSRSMSNAFLDLNGNNVLKPVKVNSRKELENLCNWKINVLNPNLMSTDEVGKLMQLPTSQLQKDFETSLVSNKRVEIELHKELLDESGILAGYATNKGVRYPVHIQTKNLDMTFTSRAIIGSPRMGKDQAAINLIVEAKRKHNIGAVILDVINEQNGHRGMGNAIRDHLPPEDVIDLNLLDTENPIYLGLEPIVKMIKDPRIAGDRVAEELCDFLLTDGDEDKLQTADYLREACKITNADILGIKFMFTSKSFRNKMIEEKKDLYDTFVWDLYNEMSEAKQSQIYTPIMRRIGQIMNSEFLKPIFCQRPNPALDLYKMVEEGKVIIFRMKSGVMSNRVIEMLCYWIVLVTFLIKLGQGGSTEKSKGTFLVLNEPHQYLTNGLAHFIERIFAEGPKYRFTPILIFHNFKQFKKFPGFVDMMKSSSLNWHIFKNTNEEVYKELFPYLNKTFESPEQAFEATKRYQYIGVWLDQYGAYYDPFVADALPMVGDRYTSFDNSDLTEKHSKIYGRPIKEVLEEIRDRNREAMKQDEGDNKDNVSKSKTTKKRVTSRK